MTIINRSCRWTCAPGLLFCAGLAVLVMPGRAHAQLAAKVSASAQFESNSNVFDLPTGSSPPGSDGRRSDTSLGYGADFDLRYGWGRQTIYANASFNKYNYQHFSELNHTDYKIDTGLDWKLGSLLDGKVEATRSRSMVPFSDLSGSALQLSTLTDQRESAEVGIKLNSEWRVLVSGFTSKDDQPVFAAPDLELTQNSGSAAIQYSGFGALTSGFAATYLSGDYQGTAGTVNPSFSQTTAALTADYKVKRATFDGSIGYSRRNSTTGTDSTSGLTGLFDLKYKLTPKTSFTVKIDRTINNYFLNSGSEIDTDAGATVDWQATYKLSVSLGYTFSYRFFPGRAMTPWAPTAPIFRSWSRCRPVISRNVGFR